MTRMNLQVRFQKRLEAETLEAATCGSTVKPSTPAPAGPHQEEAGIWKEEPAETHAGGERMPEQIAQWRGRFDTGQRRTRQIEREQSEVEEADLVKILNSKNSLTLNQLVRLSAVKNESAVLGRGAKRKS
jgi:hypothetical protein